MITEAEIECCLDDSYKEGIEKGSASKSTWNGKRASWWWSSVTNHNEEIWPFRSRNQISIKGEGLLEKRRGLQKWVVISRVLYWQASDDHLSGSVVTDGLKQPTRISANASHIRPFQAKFCLVLHRMGFTLPLLSPKVRWALTSPFHPYLHCCKRYFFCCTFRRITAPGRYPASYSAVPGLSSRFSTGGHPLPISKVVIEFFYCKVHKKKYLLLYISTRENICFDTIFLLFPLFGSRTRFISSFYCGFCVLWDWRRLWRC